MFKCPKCGHCESKDGGDELAAHEMSDDFEHEDEGDDDDDDLQAKDEVLAELEELMAQSMGKRLEKKPAALAVEVVASKGKKKKDDEEDEDEVF